MTTRQVRHQKKAFLGHFRVHGNVSQACRELDIPRGDVYRWKEHDEEFMLGWNVAEVEATESLEEEARNRAVDGTQKPVYQGGQLVGFVTEKSDTLLIFLLKARNPSKYRDKHDGAPEGQQPVKVVDREAYEAI